MPDTRVDTLTPSPTAASVAPSMPRGFGVDGRDLPAASRVDGVRRDGRLLAPEEKGARARPAIGERDQRLEELVDGGADPPAVPAASLLSLAPCTAASMACVTTSAMERSALSAAESVDWAVAMLLWNCAVAAWRDRIVTACAAPAGSSAGTRMRVPLDIRSCWCAIAARAAWSSRCTWALIMLGVTRMAAS